MICRKLSDCCDDRQNTGVTEAREIYQDCYLGMEITVGSLCKTGTTDLLFVLVQFQVTSLWIRTV
jgi:hypothetical protein